MKNPIPQFKFSRLSVLIIPFWIIPAMAFAHSGAGPHNGLLHGFSHPLSGLDHGLAMIAVGLWAAQAYGRIIWLIPLVFVMVMGLGGLLGMITLPIAFAEYGITLSLFVLGALLACRKHLPLSASIILVGLFALCHGYAHGSEMPQDVSMFPYAAGFMLATMLLHVCGIGLALLFRNFTSVSWIRFSGIIIAFYGGFLMIQ